MERKYELAEKYFTATGCVASLFRINDKEYGQMVMDRLNALNLKQKAIEKIGLDEDQLKEIPPVFLHGYNFDNAYTKIGGDNRLRSSKYDATWLFFSSTEVYMYSYTIDMVSESKAEKTEEYFYKDIVNFSSYSDTVEATKLTGCGGETKSIKRDYRGFSLVVPGEKFKCSTTGNEDADKSINAMKQKLREMKEG